MFGRWRSRRARPHPLVDIDPAQQARDIAARTGIPQAQVTAVLDLEFERMVLQGIAEAPDHVFRHYPPDEQARIRRSRDLDVATVAEDAERLAGVPVEVALRVLAEETEDLARRGLI